MNPCLLPLVRPQGLEPRTSAFVVHYSIQLSYERLSDSHILQQGTVNVNRYKFGF